MKVDRTRFLLLTTALSAATAVGVMGTGCTVTSTASDAGTSPTLDSGPGTDSSAGDSGYLDGGDSGACLTDDGIAPTCEGASLTCAPVCARILPNYKSGVGRAIIECILALPTCESATTEIANCVQNALGRACADTTAKTYCSPLVTDCNYGDAGTGDGGATGSLAQTDCEDLATGLNTTGRATFASCITEGVTTFPNCISTTATCFDAIQ